MICPRSQDQPMTERNRVKPELIFLIRNISVGHSGREETEKKLRFQAF